MLKPALSSFAYSSIAPRPGPEYWPAPALDSPADRPVLARIPTSGDTDAATIETARVMGSMIEHSSKDPLVARCLDYARRYFGAGVPDPAAVTWGIFWWVKHCVKFRTDEATMFRVGERDEQDLLISPDVLVRMKDPSEDCDGFTMLTAAMLRAARLPVFLATVAIDGDRWSHVFALTIVNGKVKPLDTSHGPAPGWMVPRSRIHRFQAWTLDGRPADGPSRAFQGLHGYVRTAPRGMGAAPAPGFRRAARPPIVFTPRGRGFGSYRRRGMGGCGDCTGWDEDGNCISTDTADCGGTLGTSTNPVDLFGPDPATIAANQPAAVQSATAAGMRIDAATGLMENCPSGSAPGSPVSSACPTGYSLNGWVCAPNPGTALGCGGSGQPACPAGGSPTNPFPTLSPNWGAIASQIVQTAGQDARVALAQPTNLLNAQTWANLSAYLPVLGIGFLAVWALTSVLSAGKK